MWARFEQQLNDGQGSVAARRAAALGYRRGPALLLRLLAVCLWRPSSVTLPGPGAARRWGRVSTSALRGAQRLPCPAVIQTSPAVPPPHGSLQRALPTPVSMENVTVRARSAGSTPSPAWEATTAGAFTFGVMYLAGVSNQQRAVLPSQALWHHAAAAAAAAAADTAGCWPPPYTPLPSSLLHAGRHKGPQGAGSRHWRLGDSTL